MRADDQALNCLFVSQAVNVTALYPLSSTESKKTLPSNPKS